MRQLDASLVLLHRRAVEGVDEPVGWSKGKAGGTIRRYSDVLLMFLAKGVLPDRYRERVEDHKTAIQCYQQADLGQMREALAQRNPLTEPTHPDLRLVDQAS